MAHLYRVTDELDVAETLTCGQTFRARQVEDGGWLLVDGQSWYRVRQDAKGIEVVSNAPEVEFRRLFGLDRPSLESTGVLWRDPDLSRSVRPRQGLRLMLQSCPVEVLFGFICSQNANVRRIEQMVDRLAAYGQAFPDNPDARRFPSLEVLATSSEAELREQRFGYRGRAIPLAAQFLLSHGGEAWLLALRTARYETAFEALQEIPGVGPKVADCVCLYGLHHLEAAPIDVHVWRAATSAWQPEWTSAAMTHRRYRWIGERFRASYGKAAGEVQQRVFVEGLRRGGG